MAIDCGSSPTSAGELAAPPATFCDRWGRARIDYGDSGMPRCAGEIGLGIRHGAAEGRRFCAPERIYGAGKDLGDERGTPFAESENSSCGQEKDLVVELATPFVAAEEGESPDGGPETLASVGHPEAVSPAPCLAFSPHPPAGDCRPGRLHADRPNPVASSPHCCAGLSPEEAMNYPFRGPP